MIVMISTSLKTDVRNKHLMGVIYLTLQIDNMFFTLIWILQIERLFILYFYYLRHNRE
jgi:hypothetical protein